MYITHLSITKNSDPIVDFKSYNLLITLNKIDEHSIMLPHAKVYMWEMSSISNN